jgi:hypothetical protein
MRQPGREQTFRAWSYAIQRGLSLPPPLHRQVLTLPKETPYLPPVVTFRSTCKATLHLWRTWWRWRCRRRMRRYW